uniref:Uncharacterized protein n=1 Tax=Glossina brevipalpis TaxID=37001 RepID=A0A1A9WNM8_9MUSC
MTPSKATLGALTQQQQSVSQSVNQTIKRNFIQKMLFSLEHNHNNVVFWLLSVFIIFITSSSSPLLVNSLIIDSNTLTATASAINQPKSRTHLASKLIFQSPSMDNILKEFIVSSKPLQLRKYSNHPKIKKSKKDSRIYFISIPPLPYRFIPGRGYDYQPLKIKPLLLDTNTKLSNKIVSDKNQLSTNLKLEKSQQQPPPPLPLSIANVKASQKSYRIEAATTVPSIHHHHHHQLNIKNPLEKYTEKEEEEKQKEEEEEEEYKKN